VAAAKLRQSDDLAVAATLLALALGAALPTPRTALLGTAVAAVVLGCSAMTSFFLSDGSDPLKCW